MWASDSGKIVNNYFETYVESTLSHTEYSIITKYNVQVEVQALSFTDLPQTKSQEI